MKKDKTTPVAPTPKKDPRLRRARINRIQAEHIAKLQMELEAAQKRDEGTVRAQTALSFYLSAITHGDGEKRPAMCVGLEKGTGTTHFLVYRPVSQA